MQNLIVELRTLYDSTNSLDYEYKNLMLTLASNHMNTKEIETILESLELKTFIDRIEKEGALDILKEEYLIKNTVHQKIWQVLDRVLLFFVLSN